VPKASLPKSAKKEPATVVDTLTGEILSILNLFPEESTWEAKAPATIAKRKNASWNTLIMNLEVSYLE
jgi:hypothetical protein